MVWRRKSLNTQEVEKSVQDVEYNSFPIWDIVEHIVTECCEGLDKYVHYVSDILRDNSSVITDEELDDIILTIPTLVYFVGECQEKIGLKQDISESTRKQLFNECFVNAVGTVQGKKSEAENKTLNDEIVSFVYGRAYNAVDRKSVV